MRGDRNRRQAGFIITSVLLCAAAMSCVDGLWHPPYALKSAVKAVLFLLVPLGYFLRHREALKTLFRPGGALRRALLLGAAVYAAILFAYFLLRAQIDFSGIAAQLSGEAGVNGGNFLFVALYISFVNSLLEEFFFRGYAFLALRRLTSRPFAYAFSALAFAAYHAGMTAGWFRPAVWALAMLGLFAGGCVFNRLNEKEGSIYPSWLVHMCANFAINTVGFILFGMI